MGLWGGCWVLAVVVVQNPVVGASVLVPRDELSALFSMMDLVLLVLVVGLVDTRTKGGPIYQEQLGTFQAELSARRGWKAAAGSTARDDDGTGAVGGGTPNMEEEKEEAGARCMIEEGHQRNKRSVGVE